MLFCVGEALSIYVAFKSSGQLTVIFNISIYAFMDIYLNNKISSSHVNLLYSINDTFNFTNK